MITRVKPVFDSFVILLHPTHFLSLNPRTLKMGDAVDMLSRRSEIIRSNLIWIIPAKESCYL